MPGMHVCVGHPPAQCWCSRASSVHLEPSAVLQRKPPMSAMLLQGLKWEFAVIDEIDPNAFVVPGETAVGITLDVFSI